jgi:hypothetical protein
LPRPKAIGQTFPAGFAACENHQTEDRQNDCEIAFHVQLLSTLICSVLATLFLTASAFGFSGLKNNFLRLCF